MWYTLINSTSPPLCGIAFELTAKCNENSFCQRGLSHRNQQLSVEAEVGALLLCRYLQPLLLLLGLLLTSTLLAGCSEARNCKVINAYFKATRLRLRLWLCIRDNAANQGRNRKRAENRGRGRGRANQMTDSSVAQWGKNSGAGTVWGVGRAEAMRMSRCQGCAALCLGQDIRFTAL